MASSLLSQAGHTAFSALQHHHIQISSPNARAQSLPFACQRLSSPFIGRRPLGFPSQASLTREQRGSVSLGVGRKGVTTCAASGAGVSSEGPAQVVEEGEALQAGGSFGAKLRAVLFYLTTFTLAIPLFVAMLLLFPFQWLFDRYKRSGMHFVNKLWANATSGTFYRTEVQGWENLPAESTPAVYVANHQSFLDIYTLFRLGRPFKFISKTSNFLIPIIGWSMFLTGHVPIKRIDTRSQMKCLQKCLELLKLGSPVLFFPEGTRTKDNKIASFKKGAFSIAAKAGVPVVPVTLIGTGKLMPNGKENTLHPGSVKMIVHKPLIGRNADKLCEEAYEVITKALRENGYTEEFGYP